MLPNFHRSSHKIVDVLNDNVVGNDNAIETPYGVRRVTYADYTASGRCVDFIEKFLLREVMPLYANTHTETSGTGLQTTHFRENAREIIRHAINASEDDAVIFVGSGATGAINQLVEVLNLRIPRELDQKYKFLEQIPENDRPVVFIGPYEHHSNELPWRESIADVVVIDEDHNGQPNLQHLEEQLMIYHDRPLKIGSFSRASNVTGIETPTRAICQLLHKYGALSFFDYASAAPYVKIDMNPEPLAMDYKDAVFISPHKFIGGPGTPGLLIAKKTLFQNVVPAMPGGGTVQFVSSDSHKYVDNPEIREEGGTPNILGAIKAGLVFQLKEAVGADLIHKHEQSFIRRAITSWSKSDKILILGNTEAPRLSIVSFMIRHGEGFLHHNFVVALLNDLFGIQARGGCSCAGPYGHRLLGIDLTTSREYMTEISAGSEGIKPGWVRVNFNYFISEASFDFVVRAILMVANHGWRMLPQYMFDQVSGQWWHHKKKPSPPLDLSDITYQNGKMEYCSRHAKELESNLPRYLSEAEEFMEAHKIPPMDNRENLSKNFDRLRWFPTPEEVANDLKSNPDQITPFKLKAKWEGLSEGDGCGCRKFIRARL
eukprot:TRINITY_DN291427_c0_g3_i1.p1 TRINITY_DN291427_c0_g3~~TRINITY_DN291427_c0_g3_i1.p1  ORF type:complete len:601 (-),score=185.31 TRINITY_DN291427_c0_g3_i1:747-2549(-)